MLETRHSMKSKTSAARSAIVALAARNNVLDMSEAGGRLELYMPRPDIVFTIVSGHLSAAMAQRWVDTTEPFCKRGTIFDTFNDWEGMSGYDSGARSLLTKYMIATRRSNRSCHFLVASRVVAMGVSTASLATGLAGFAMHATTSRRDFEKMLGAAL